jgi:ABC-type sugar transport system ATPase subunit
MASVTLHAIKKSYDGDTHVIKGVDLSIADGEFLVLVGPSGCGKSTLLRTIAGLEEITAGELMIGDRVVNDVAPRDRGIGMVFQSYALYPHMTVRDNMAFGLKIRKIDPGVIAERVSAAATQLGLTEYLDRYPKQLSGGQRQRVAMGRAIVRQPEVFLFDEPLSNLDAALRNQMRVELKKLHQRLGATMIYVTHDQVEAMTLADRIAILDQGHLQQVGPPGELYDRPANTFVAGFIGSPAMNMFPADSSSPHWDLPSPAGAHTLGVRPQHLSLARPGDALPEGWGTLTGTLDVVEPMGWEAHIHLDAGDARVIAHVEVEDLDGLSPGDPVTFHIDPTRIHPFDSGGDRVQRAGSPRSGGEEE